MAWTARSNPCFSPIHGSVAPPGLGEKEEKQMPCLTLKALQPFCTHLLIFSTLGTLLLLEEETRWDPAEPHRASPRGRTIDYHCPTFFFQTDEE